MQTANITINSSILDSSLHSTTLDFSAFSSIAINDYFELTLDNLSVKLNINSNMTVSNFVEWLASNYNNNYDFYKIATASNNNAVLNIVSKAAESIDIHYDFNR